MRTVGQRKEAPLTFAASAELLVEGTRLSDEIQRLPTGNRTFILKGVYRFTTFEEANRQDLECIVKGMVQGEVEWSGADGETIRVLGLDRKTRFS
jgi:hypothetical protein